MIIVSICCISYNHRLYITECIEGFLRQQTNFTFEILIFDDASTDGTQDIIKEYASKNSNIRTFLQTENQWIKQKYGLTNWLFPAAQGKYIALCEGDDYWTDPLKLQKQVDFLEANPDYSLVAGGYIERKENTGEEQTIIRTQKDSREINDNGFEITIERFVQHWFTKSLTVMYRAKDIDYSVILKYKYLRDVHLYYYLLRNGKGFYMKEVFGVYQIHEGGTHSMISRSKQVMTNYNVYRELYNHHPEDFREVCFKVTVAMFETDGVQTKPAKRTLWPLIRTREEFVKLANLLGIHNRIILGGLVRVARLFGKIQN